MKSILANIAIFDKSHIFFIFLGLMLGFFAAIISFVISFSELTRHFSGRREPLKISLRTAVITLMFFLILSVILGFFIKI